MNDSSGEGSNIVGTLMVGTMLVGSMIVGITLLLNEADGLLSQLLNLS